jgi:Signal transduction histidine kinase, nitrogen specific
MYFAISPRKTFAIPKSSFNKRLPVATKDAVSSSIFSGLRFERGQGVFPHLFNDTLVLEISDPGKGIPEAWMFRNIPNHQPDGRGLGLPLVSKIISAPRGTVDYCGQPGKCTTFGLSLLSDNSELLGYPLFSHW